MWSDDVATSCRMSLVTSVLSVVESLFVLDSLVNESSVVNVLLSRSSEVPPVLDSLVNETSAVNVLLSRSSEVPAVLVSLVNETSVVNVL